MKCNDYDFFVIIIIITYRHGALCALSNTTKVNTAISVHEQDSINFRKRTTFFFVFCSTINYYKRLLLQQLLHKICNSIYYAKPTLLTLTLSNLAKQYAKLKNVNCVCAVELSMYNCTKACTKRNARASHNSVCIRISIHHN